MARWQTRLKLVVLSLSLSLLFACQSKPPSDRVEVDDLNLQNVDNQNKAIKIAISQLEVGKVLDAEIIINQVLRVNPSHVTATLLKNQLNTPPKQLFKTSRTTQYKIKSGDTLGSIAKEWLGNSIYFVSLAKLNHLKNPKKLRPGKIIKIPVTKNSPLVKKEKRRSQANLRLLQKYSDNHHYVKALKRMTNIFILQSDYKKLVKLQNKILTEYSQSKVTVPERHKMILQVKQIAKNSKRAILNKSFKRFHQQQLNAVLLDEFMLLFEAKSYDKAAEKLIRAIKIKPNLEQSSDYFSTQQLLVDKLHEKAILLRKNQQLQQAVDSWELILKIQPKNDLALKYYHRTKRLLERLKGL